MGIPHGKSHRLILALALAKSQVLEVHRALSPAPVPPCVLESNAYGEIPAVAQVEMVLFGVTDSRIARKNPSDFRV